MTQAPESEPLQTDAPPAEPPQPEVSVVIPPAVVGKDLADIDISTLVPHPQSGTVFLLYVSLESFRPSALRHSFGPWAHQLTNQNRTEHK